VRFGRNAHGWRPFFSPGDRFQPGFWQTASNPMMKIAFKSPLGAMLAAKRVGTHDEWLTATLGQVAQYP